MCTFFRYSSQVKFQLLSDFNHGGGVLEYGKPLGRWGVLIEASFRGR